MNTKLIIHPAVSQLQGECERLRTTFAEMIGEYDKIKHKILPTIENIYQGEFGLELAELLQLEFETKAMQFRIRKLQTAINHDQTVDPEKIEAEIRQEFADWTKRITAQQRQIKNAENFLNGEFLTVEEARKLNEIYRTLAKKLHPDVAENYSERKEELWLLASQAYRDGNVERLKQILTVCELESIFSDDQTKPESSIEKLEKFAEKLKAQIKKLFEDMASLRKSETYLLGENLEDPEWIAEQHDVIRTKIKIQEVELKRLEAIFKNLLPEVSQEKPFGISNTEDEWDDIIY